MREVCFMVRKFWHEEKKKLFVLIDFNHFVKNWTFLDFKNVYLLDFQSVNIET